jgi:hypothetical protein
VLAEHHRGVHVVGGGGNDLGPASVAGPSADVAARSTAVGEDDRDHRKANHRQRTHSRGNGRIAGQTFPPRLSHQQFQTSVSPTVASAQWCSRLVTTADCCAQGDTPVRGIRPRYRYSCLLPIRAVFGSFPTGQPTRAKAAGPEACLTPSLVRHPVTSSVASAVARTTVAPANCPLTTCPTLTNGLTVGLDVDRQGVADDAVGSGVPVDDHGAGRARRRRH